ncbi:MAG: EAL domain-containing protein [Gammaproteobacteria bacterium]
MAGLVAATIWMKDVSTNNRTRVLYIEDSRIDALKLTRSLGKEGKNRYQVDWAGSLQSALEMIRQRDFDVVITDLYLPDVSALNIVPSLLEAKNDLPIVVISGEDSEEIAIQVVNLGAQDCLVKDRADAYLVSRSIEYAIERKKIEKGLQFLAQYDSLTGLANRMLFRERLNRAMIRADRHKKIVALIFIDLDRFKNINDSMGHDVGDQLLVEIATRLRQCTREGDTIARLGGDEFTIILEDISQISDASLVANKILDAMLEPVNINGFEIFATPSMGITLYPIDDSNTKDLLRNADAAMYKAKEDGRNCYRFYTSDMNRDLEDRIVLENYLRHAIENHEFELHYQPKFNIQNNALIGAEALLRWHSPRHGMVSPAIFIPLAEETGLIHPITEWVVKEACQQNSSWQLKGYPPIRMAINLSPKQFKRPNIARTIFNKIVFADLSPRYIELEITESALMEDVNKSNEILKELKKWGIQISIDDFGTGYSSLSYLKKFPIDTLKIDQSFVRDILEDKDDAAIVSAIIAMANSLRLNVIAEGVETGEQLNFLAAEGCNEVQGYFLGRPIPASEFEATFFDSETVLVRRSASAG